MIREFKSIVWLTLLIPLASVPVRAAEQDPSACVNEIERVCAQMEDHLETCLDKRGDKLSAPCRDQLQKAMDLMEDPSGPAACIPDVQRLCPDLKAKALASCMSDQQANFSAACQQYLQSASHAAASE
jgi:hypothetical protein